MSTILNNVSAPAASYQPPAQTKKATEVNAVRDDALKSSDTFEKTAHDIPPAVLAAKTSAYDKNSAVQAVRAAQETRDAALQDMLKQSIAKQGEAFNVSIMGVNYKVDSETMNKAKQMISEDGDLGVKKMADSAMAMVRALSGGDIKHFDTLKDAVMKAYDQASKSWGGKLPQICEDTRKEINSRFDQWKETGEILLSDEKKQPAADKPENTPKVEESK